MNYEERYNQALERAKIEQETFFNLGNVSAKTAIERIFPELHKSKDERIRKEIIELVHFFYGSSSVYEHHVSENDMITWLEKQGEQKSVEQDTEIHDLWMYIREWNDKFGRLPVDEDELEACINYVMKRQKPNRWKPSKEQMEALNKAKNSPANYYTTILELQSLYNDLKKL